MIKKCNFTYNDIISLENLLEAWREFLCGKKNREDVQEFERNLIGSILSLHSDLKSKSYTHGSYHAFNISDPKPRNIHKASVRDRLLHHAIYRVLYPYFDKVFINDSYSCRVGKGTHKALERFKQFSCKVSKNNTKQVFVLKCDVRKFFASIDHPILLDTLKKYIQDTDILWLLNQVISSYNPGLPLGNLTSQLLVNIYMNQFDQWMKHRMKVKYYIRYADDFVILHRDKDYLQELTYKIGQYLEEELKLRLHPNKVFIKTIYSGLDFLGWVHFPNHRVLRTATKKRMLKRVKETRYNEETVQSYLGLLDHGNAKYLKDILISMC